MAGTLAQILANKADLVDGKVKIEQLPETIGGNGLSAYELAVQEGFSGTLEEWLISLHGEDGADGYTPVKGVDYFDGAKGDKGDKGDQGDRGLQGIQGIQGPPGSDATVTKSAVEAVLTGEISSHTHAGGSGGLTQAQIRRII